MKPGVIIPWLFVALVAVGMPILTAIERGEEATSDEPKERVVSAQMEMVAKNVMGWKSVAEGDGEELQPQVDGAAVTEPERVAAAILAVETLGKDKALERLAAMESADARVFAAWYADGTAVPDDVTARYGYFGRLSASLGRPSRIPAGRQ